MATEWLNSFCSNVVVVGFAVYERENEKKKRKDNSLLIYSDARDRKSLWLGVMQQWMATGAAATGAAATADILLFCVIERLLWHEKNNNNKNNHK